MIFDVVIPARGGSKRIPGKNIKKFFGKPLLVWSIELAKMSKRIRSIYVSTDDEEIAAVAKESGAEVINRPGVISGDLATDLECLQHFTSVISDMPDAIVQLRPTYPSRRVSILEKLLDLFEEGTPSSIRTVIPTEHPPYKTYVLGRFLEPLVPELSGIKRPYDLPTQLLPPTYRHNGYIDIVGIQTVIDGSVSGDRILGYVMEPGDFHDIDTPEEWESAEKHHASTITS